MERDELLIYLSTMRNQGLINDWDDEDILPGAVWEQGIFERLNRADIILLLISPDFIASSQCSRQMERALERQKTQAVRVIPVLMRTTDIDQSLIGKLRALPRNHKPVSHWQKRDEAFFDIVQGIRAVIETMQTTIKTNGELDMPLASLSLWNVPFRRNLLFTGREQVLTNLSETLSERHRVALSGLGGIGKTQIAIEYAYRHRDVYQAILWVRAGTTEEITADFVSIAELLNLPEKDAQVPTVAVQAVHQWLIQHKNWLLILDNADDFKVIHPYIPSGDGGHILLTTRTQVMSSIAHKIEIHKMDDEEATQLLLRRAGMADYEGLAAETVHELRSQAAEIAGEVDGLPLAIDQAGAYVEETGCGLSTYLQLYRQQRAQFLAYRGGIALDYPLSVSTTWQLSFQEVERINPSASALLKLCAFFSAESIPEEFLNGGASYAGTELESIATDLFAFNDALKVLLMYSLLSRNRINRTITIHRLVQNVIQDKMDQPTQEMWAKRAIEAVSAVLNDNSEGGPRYQRYIAHALLCVDYIERWSIELERSAQVLNEVARYLRRQSQLVKALSFCQQALVMREKILGEEHPDVAATLNVLASISYGLGNYTDTGLRYQRALAILEKTRGSEHPHTLGTLYHLARLYKRQGNYPEAASVYQRVLALQETILGTEHPQTLRTLQQLADLYGREEKYTEAVSMLQQALALQKKILGPEHLDTARTLWDLAVIYRKQENAEEALPLAQEALTIAQKEFGVVHLTTAAYRLEVGRIYVSQKRYEDAVPLIQETLQTYENLLGAEHLHTAITLRHLAEVYHKQGNNTEAASLFQRAMAIAEKVLQPDHPDMASFSDSLAQFYSDQELYSEALPLYERTLAIREKVLGMEHPTTIKTRQELVNVLDKMQPNEQNE